jgi:hypothetical protein
VVALVATACSCGTPRPETDAGMQDSGTQDAGTQDAGTADGGVDGGTDGGDPCPSGCGQLIRDGGPVFYEDGGPYCLC